jgi:hypothetical protein
MDACIQTCGLHTNIDNVVQFYEFRRFSLRDKYKYVYIYIYIYIYTYIYTYIHTHTYAHMHAYIHT